MRSSVLLACLVVATPAVARAIRAPEPVVPDLMLRGAPIGGKQPADRQPAHLAGGRLVAIPGGALVVDADSGLLVKTTVEGAPLARLAIGADAGLAVVDDEHGVAYVADRAHDRIVVAELAGLAVTRALPTPAEPYGVALTPDRRTLLVTAIADRLVVAYDVATGAERWRAAVGAEPRGIAVSPDGTRALVASLATGDVAQVALGGAHAVTSIAIAAAAGRAAGSPPVFARGAFAVSFVGDHQAVVPFAREIPIGRDRVISATRRGLRPSSGRYGGGGMFEDPPVTQELAFLGVDGGGRQVTAQTAVHQARALAWDGARDALYVAGLGSDTVLQVADASRRGVRASWVASLVNGDERCGPDGVAVAGDRVLVWCAFARRVVVLGLADGAPSRDRPPTVRRGPVLTESAMAEPQHAGYVLFHAASSDISTRGQLACASCHPEGRADGLTWQIDHHRLQTPVLAGRIAGTAPYKWDGTDETLGASLGSTMQRLGGRGLDAERLGALAAYLEALPAPRTPTRDAAAVARGRAVFASAGCASCHDGAAYTDLDRHHFGGTLDVADTPSLVGIAASAPYYHDGSAPTLPALLRGAGTVHGMLGPRPLSAQQAEDLAAFLETR